MKKKTSRKGKKWFSLAKKLQRKFNSDPGGASEAHMKKMAKAWENAYKYEAGK